MKTQPLYRRTINYACYIVIFLWTAFSVNAQCPTIPNQTPAPICDASGFTFSDLNTYAVDGGNGIAWYSASTGGSPFNGTQLVAEGTYYVDDDSGACGTRLSITIDFQVDDSGQNLDGIYCSNDNPTVQTYITDVLQPNIPIGGSVEVYNDFNLTMLASGTDLLPSGATNYFIVFIDNGGCESQLEIGSTAIFVAPNNPTPTTPQLFCSDTNPTITDLDPGTLDAHSWYESLDGFGDPIPPALLSSTALTDGNTYYVQIDGVFCDSHPVAVNVTIDASVEAGNAVNQVFCESDVATTPALDLFDLLVGEDSGGIWTDNSASTISNILDISSFTVVGSPYQFTYTVTNGVCIDSEAITIIVAPVPESGTALAPIEICEENIASNSPLDLFTILDGTQDTNGTWYIGTDTSGSTTTNSVDITGFTDGTYNYTYSVPAIGTCTDVDVTVQVIILPQPNTGIPSAPIFCENDLASNSPLDLFGELTGEDSGGTWTDDDATGALTVSDVDITTLTIGSYSFTYSITAANGCTNSTTVTITVEDAPESGTVNAPMEFCISDIVTAQSFDLFDLLEGEDQTGVWLDDDSTGALSGNLVTIDGLSTGTYNFTFNVDDIGTCDDVLVTVSIVINDTSGPTVTSATQDFCDSATIADLSATGTTIQWYDELTGGSALVGTLALVDGETYYATQTDATTSCESSVRTEVTVTIYQSSNPGNASATAIAECNNNNNIDLNTGLDGSQDAGGVWQDTDGTGALTGNIFDATGIAAGTYQFTYFVTASAPCVDDSITITVTIDEPLNAGTDNVLDVCSNNGTTDLFTLIGSADTGGTWSPALSSGTGVFDPLVDVDGTYTYSLTNACGTDTSEVIVTVTQAPIAGVDTSVTICVIDGVTDLFPLLGSAHTGGVWSPTLTSATGEFDPTVDAAGVYTYTVVAVAPCLADAVAQVTVTVEDTSAPVVIINNPEFCLVDNPTVADLDNNISSSGTLIWYADAAQTTVLNSTDVLIDGEDYYGTQTNASGCESSSNTQVTVTINDKGTPTLVNSNLELCINDNPTINDLTLNITERNGTLSNVRWYDAETNGTLLTDTTLLTNQTTYYVALYDEITGCESSVRLQVNPDLTSCGKLVLPDGFSPNGDGTNDTFDYNNLDILYPNFTMEIYNRYGTAVYKGNVSTPRFNGKSNQSGSLGKGDLPVGVYFYIFNFNDGVNKSEQGRLYLSR